MQRRQCCLTNATLNIIISCWSDLYTQRICYYIELKLCSIVVGSNTEKKHTGCHMAKYNLFFRQKEQTDAVFYFMPWSFPFQADHSKLLPQPALCLESRCCQESRRWNLESWRSQMPQLRPCQEPKGRMERRTRWLR